MRETCWQRHTLREIQKHNDRDTLRKTHPERDTQRHTETCNVRGSHTLRENQNTQRDTHNDTQRHANREGHTH